mmetsp:Transcript_28602/g.91167  ORF Transcript_28602/g.91167 Transcript_28602/m.91167 type:complete len:274 (-) Transcript_28602:804-1625(-)
MGPNSTYPNGNHKRIAYWISSRPGHEVKEVEDEVAALAQDVVRLTAVGLEPRVVRAARAPHRLHHLLAKLHGRGAQLGVPAHDEAEVDVEDAAVRGQQQVVQVAVPHPQDECDHAVPRAAAHERLQHLGRHPVGPLGVRAVQAEVRGDGAVVAQHHRQRLRGGHELDEAVVAARGEHAVGGEAQVEALPLEQPVHQGDHLHHQLVLAQVVALLEDDRALPARRRAEGQTQRVQCAAEHGGLPGDHPGQGHLRVVGQRDAARDGHELPAEALLG